MEKRSLVIELGDQFTKICVHKGKAKTSGSISAFIFQNPPDAVVDGAIADIDAITKLIKTNLLSRKLKSVKNVHFVCTSQKIILREVIMPAINPKQLKSMIETNASDYFPVNVANYYFSHSILETIESKNNALRVMITAIPKHVIRGMFELANKLGLTVKSIDSETNAQHMLLCKYTPEDKNILYFNIDQTTSIATFMQGKNLLMQRNLPIGGEDTIAATINAGGLDITSENYENDDYLNAIRKLNDEAWLSQVLAEDEIELALARIISGIERSIELFYSSKKDTALNAVVLTGTYGIVSELKDLVQKTVDLPCFFIYDLIDESDDLAKIDYMSFFFSCLGGTIEPLDFMPDELTKGTKKGKAKDKNSLNTGILVVSLCIILSIVVVIFPYMEYKESQNKLITMRSELDKFSYVIDYYNEYLAYEEAFNNLDIFVKEGFNENENLVALFEEFEENMPSSILFASMICSENDVSINITVDDFEDAAIVLSQIREFETIEITSVTTFNEVTAELATLEAGAEDSSLVEFSLTCTYKSIIEERNNAAIAELEAIAEAEAEAETTEVSE